MSAKKKATKPQQVRNYGSTLLCDAETKQLITDAAKRHGDMNHGAALRLIAMWGVKMMDSKLPQMPEQK